MTTCPRRFVVITGGPGAGKSTLLQYLARNGYSHMPESGRAIITDQVSIDGPALPWADRQLFAELMLGWDLRSYRQAAEVPGTVFFDRGVVDLVGYLRLEGLPVPAHIHAAAQRFRYHTTVFLAPFWPEIYRLDDERKQSPEIAQRTCEVMADVYREYGYTLVSLPRVPVGQRARFVLDTLG